LAGDDASDMRPVTAFVRERGLRLSRRDGEVTMPEGLLERERRVLPKMRMITLHARIEHGPHDPFARGGERRERSVRLDRADRPSEQRSHLKVGPYAEDHASRRIGGARNRRAVQTDHRLYRSPGDTRKRVLVAQLRLSIGAADFEVSSLSARKGRGCEIAYALSCTVAPAGKV